VSPPEPLPEVVELPLDVAALPPPPALSSSLDPHPLETGASSKRVSSAAPKSPGEIAAFLMISSCSYRPVEHQAMVLTRSM
jgi:hypothetical protein